MLGINTIKIPPSILSQLCDIDEFKGLWAGLDRHTTGLQLLGDVADYGANFKRVLGPLQERPIDIELLCIVTANQIGEKEPCMLKSAANQLPISAGDKVFGTLDTAEPEEVEPVLRKLCEWVNETLEQKSLHPLLVAAVFASVFLQLAPFKVGNLRTMRFVVMLIMLKSGYAYSPYANLTTVMDNHGKAVFEALKSNQDSLAEGAPDWNDWLICFFTILQDQKNTLYERLYAKETELRNLSALSSKIMALFKDHKRLQMKEIIKLTNGRRATIKLRLQELIDGGYLVRHGAGRGTWYALV